VAVDQGVAGLRERLEREGWGAAYGEGQALPFGEVAALALALLEDAAQAPAGPALAEAVPQTVPERAQGPVGPARQEGPLSEREREVLRLVAEGLSSKAIGRRLFLAPSTVNNHLASIFRKLGADTRAQAVAVAAQRGLL
jgi:DNA-binding CsgD family transcriptional regulator